MDTIWFVTGVEVISLFVHLVSAVKTIALLRVVNWGTPLAGVRLAKNMRPLPMAGQSIDNAINYIESTDVNLLA